MSNRYPEVQPPNPEPTRFGFSRDGAVRAAIAIEAAEALQCVWQAHTLLIDFSRSAIPRIDNRAAVTIANHAFNDFQDLCEDLHFGEGRSASRVARSLFENLVNFCEVSGDTASADRYTSHESVTAQIRSRMTSALTLLKGGELQSERFRLKKLGRDSEAEYSDAIAKYGRKFKRDWSSADLHTRAIRHGYGLQYDSYRLLSQVTHGSSGGALGTVKGIQGEPVHRTGVSLELAILAYLEGLTFFASLIGEISKRFSVGDEELRAALDGAINSWSVTAEP